MGCLMRLGCLVVLLIADPGRMNLAECAIR